MEKQVHNSLSFEPAGTDNPRNTSAHSASPGYDYLTTQENGCRNHSCKHISFVVLLCAQVGVQLQCDARSFGKHRIIGCKDYRRRENSQEQSKVSCQIAAVIHFGIFTWMHINFQLL
jgi:hypothetical protein